MLFNKNIILEILQSEFGEQIDAMIENCVMDLEPYELDTVFEYSADYAFLDGIEEMSIAEYEVEKEHGNESVCGVLEVKVSIIGYTHWDGEEVHVDDGIVTLGIGFCFTVNGGNYSDLELECVY